MSDVITKETLERCSATLAAQRIVPQPFVIQATVSRAGEIAEALGCELSLDEKGEQTIGDYLIRTRRLHEDHP